MKKLNKFFAVLVALAMMATLCVMSAFAADTPTYDPAQAKLAKYLQKGTGVDDPGATYNFTFTPVTSGAPAAANTSITLSDTDANGDMYGFKTIAAIFDGVTWPSTGVYEYTVAEAAATKNNAEWDEDADPNDTLTTDDAQYTLRVYIQSVGGTNTITGVTVADEEGAKVDPTNPDEVADDAYDWDTTVTDGFGFTNIYTKNLVDPDQDQDEQDKTGVLDVAKNVTGNYGDKVNGFPFELDYTLPQANQGAVKYKVIPAAVTEAAAIAEIEEQTASNGKIEVSLAHGDKLIITQAPQGTTWSVTENLTSATVQNKGSYTASSDKYMPNPAPAKGADLTTVTQTLTQADAITVTNAFDDSSVTPTGILMNNLPYIVLALVAIGGLVAYVVIRRREEDNA